MSYKIITLNPLVQIEHLFKIDGYEGNIALGHIKYDAKVDTDYDYQIIREVSHDGTMLFTMMLIRDSLMPIVLMETYCGRDISAEEIENVAHIDYTIGNIILESEFGQINTELGKMPGVTETVTIPIKCKYTFKGENEK